MTRLPKKVFYLLFVCLAALSISVSAFLPVKVYSAPGGGVLRDSALSIGEETAPSGPVASVVWIGLNSNRQQEFEISLSGAAGERATVFYRTRNGSAVANRNFVPLDQTISLGAGETAKVYVQIGDSQVYALVDKTGNQRFGLSFALEIYRVDGGSVSESAREAEAVIDGYSYPVKSDGNEILATNVANGQNEIKVKWRTSSDANYDSENNYRTSDFTSGVSPDIEGKMVAAGYAQLPLDYSARYLLEHGAETYVDVSNSWETGIWGAKADIKLKIRTAASADAQEIRESVSIYEAKAKYYDLWNHDTGFFHLFDEINHDPKLFEKTSGNAVWLQGRPFVNLGVNGNANRAFTVTVSHGGSYFVRCESMTASYLIHDAKAPEIVGYYVQNSSYRGGDKITVAVKFDEFVRVDPDISPDYKTYPSLRVSDGTDGGSFLLNYGGGDGTDTLYFTGTAPEKSGAGFQEAAISLNKLEVIGYRNFGTICDFSHGGESNARPNYFDRNSPVNQSALEASDPDSVQMELTVDTRQPKLKIIKLQNERANGTVVEIADASTALFRVAKATIEGDDVSDGAELKYSWTKEANAALVSDWSTTTLSSNNGSKPTAIVTSPPSLNGIGYLHYRYVAPNGNRAEGTTSFRFDNTGPESMIAVASGDNPNRYAQSHKITILTQDRSAGDGVPESGVSYVGYALSESPKAAIPVNDFTECAFDGSEITVSVPADLIGKYYVYVRAVDKNYVESVARSEFVLLFDTRAVSADSITVAISGTPNALYDDWAQLADNAYYNAATLRLSYATGIDWEFSSVTKNGLAIASPTLSKTESGCTTVLTASFRQVGYYEVVFRPSALSGSQTIESGKYAFYVFHGAGDDGLNYAALHRSETGEGNYLVTKYWMMIENRYFRLEDQGLTPYYFCADERSNLVFSSQTAAFRYVKSIEEQDVTAVRLTEAFASALNSGAYVKADKSVTAAAGDTWYRYKPFNFSTMGGASQYYYYYYPLSDTNGQLYKALTNNVNRMVGTVEAGEFHREYLYAGAEDIMNYESGKAALSFDQIRHDERMIADTIGYLGGNYRVTGNYVFTDAEQTRLFYRRHTEDGRGAYYALPAGIAKELLSPSGLYDIREIGYRGIKEYTVYVDGEAPALLVELINGAGTILPLDTIVASIEIEKLNLRSMHFKGIRGDEIDPWSILTIRKGGVSVYTATMTELTQQGGFLLDREGSYTVGVYDRTGNKISFSVVIERDPIDISLETRSSTFRFTVNRRASEIQSMRVRFNGQIITSDAEGNNLEYPTTNVFTFGYSGVYEFEVTDIYNYTFLKNDFNCFKPTPEGIFTRLNPDTGGYDTITDAETIKKIDEFSYLIYTNSAIRFQYYNAAFTIEWIGMRPTGAEESTVGTGTQVFRLNIPDSSEGWSFRLLYKKDPYVFVTYTCINDTTPPVVNAEGFNKGVAFSVENGATVTAERVTVTWSDPETAVTSVVYRFGDREMHPALGATFLNCTAQGTYFFTVRNLLGLETALSFTLDNEVSVDAVSDGVILPSGQSYGHSDILLKLHENVQIMVRGGMNRSFFLSYRGDVIKINGIPPENADAGGWSDEGTAYDLALVAAGERVAPEELKEYYNVYYGRDENGVPYAALYAPGESDKNSVYSFEIEITDFYGNAADAYLADVSRVTSSPEFSLADGTPFTGNAINVDVKIDRMPSDEDVTEIVYAFSEDGKRYGDPVFVYNTGTLTPVVFSVNGYYKVTVKNKYGNSSDTIVRLCREVSLSVLAIYNDKETIEVNNTEVYSNNQVRFIATFDVAYQVTATKNGAPVTLSFSQNSDTGRFEMTVLDPGNYTIGIRDDFGNDASYDIVITRPASVEPKEFLTGFNQKALKKDEHYTNKPLLFDQNALGDIWYIRYEYGSYVETEPAEGARNSAGSQFVGVSRVVYDRLGVRPVNALSSRIGTDGDGVYRVVFMGRSGDKVLFDGKPYLEIRYRSEGGIRLERETRGEEGYRPYSLSDALRFGFWSNYKLRFGVTAEQYRFTVNGTETPGSAETEIVMTAEMTDAAYEIYFLDEYGNEYEFTAYLDKREPAVSFLDPSKLVELDGVWYCGSEVVIVCDTPGVSAEYRKDNLDAVPYRIGDPLLEDGSYEVTFTDRAGNRSRLFFNIDTVVDVKLTRSGDAASVPLIDREVVNDATVRISRTGSEAISVVKVVKDGKDETERFAGAASWSEAGEYTVTAADPVGNTVDLRFYIVKGAVSAFRYEAPEGWAITNVTIEVGGIKRAAPEYIQRDDRGVTFVELTGNYLFEVTLTDKNEILNILKFTVPTDVVAPTALIENLAEKTKNDVIIRSVDEDATVNIYRDGQLYKTLSVKAGEKIDESITEKGVYRISIVDGAGNETIYEFERMYTMNGFAVAVVIIVCVVLSVAVLLFFVARKRMKVR